MKRVSLFFAVFAVMTQAHGQVQFPTQGPGLSQIKCEFLNMKLNIERFATNLISYTKMELDQGTNHIVYNTESEIPAVRMLDAGSQVTYQLGSNLHVVTINSAHGKDASSLKIGQQGEIRGTCTETKY